MQAGGSSVADVEVRLLDAKLAALDEQKRSLMQKLLTGKMTVEVRRGVTWSRCRRSCRRCSS